MNIKYNCIKVHNSVIRCKEVFCGKGAKNEMTMISLFALPALLIPNAWTVII